MTTKEKGDTHMKKHFIIPVIVTSTVEYDIVAETEEEAMERARERAGDDDLGPGSNIDYEIARPVDTYEA